MSTCYDRPPASRSGTARLETDHGCLGGVTCPQVGVPLTAAVPDGLDDAPFLHLAQPEAARSEVLAADELVLFVLGHEPRHGGNRTQNLDPNVTVVDLLELSGKRLRSLQLHSPHGHVQV